VSRLREWAPAVVTAAALYGFPWALLAVLDVGGLWFLALAADLLVLAAVAIFLWSPLVVLVAAVVSAVFGAIYLLAVAAADTCGDSTAATVVELTGAVAIMLTVGTWGVRRGPRALWAIPAGWALAAVWVGIWAHLIPGGSGGCFE
jgi:hypothetical protein